MTDRHATHDIELSSDPNRRRQLATITPLDDRERSHGQVEVDVTDGGDTIRGPFHKYRKVGTEPGMYAAYGRVNATERFAAAPPAEGFVRLTVPQIEFTLRALNAASVEYPTEAAREAYEALRAAYRQLTGTDWNR